MFLPVPVLIDISDVSIVFSPPPCVIIFLFIQTIAGFMIVR